MSWVEDMGYDAYDGEDMNKVSLEFDENEFRFYWETSEGERIFIEDMENSHIKNILKGDGGRFTLDDGTRDRFILELSMRRNREKWRTSDHE